MEVREAEVNKFTITCNKCGSNNCRIETNANYEYVETNLICDDCDNFA